MMIRRFFLALMFTTACTAVCWAQVRIGPKLVEEQQTRREVTQESKQVLSIAGMDIDSNSQSRQLMSTKTGTRNGAGQITVTEVLEHLQVSISAQGMDYAFDSNSPDKAGTSALDAVLRSIHKATIGRTAVTTYDNENKIVGVAFQPDILATLSEESRKQVEDQLSPDALKKEAIQRLDRFPKSAVSKGDTWRVSEKKNLGSGQVMTFDIEFTYEGTINVDGQELEKITSKVVGVDFALEANSPLPFTVKNAKLKATESRGETMFDNRQGLSVSESDTTRIEGTMDFTINNMDLPVKLDLRLTTSQKLLK